MLTLSTILKHYKRKDIQKAILAEAKDKEIAVKYGNSGFGKRPDTLQHEGDIIESAKQGATSFHASEESWKNVLQIDTLMKDKELSALRKGWDLILDLDACDLEFSKLGADLIVKALKYYEIKSVFCKFSGNKGFHIAVPFEAFPKKVHEKETKLLYPDGPRKIAIYLREMIREHLAKEILKKYTIKELMKKSGKKFNELIINNKLDPFELIDIDTILISKRHLYRMTYSFNEKSGLISVPISPDRVLEFDKEQAKPENIKVERKFLDRENIVEGEARQLIVQALDFNIEKEDLGIIETKEFDAPSEAIPEQFFPPCIQHILKGLEDGRKRALFILVNFLSSSGWTYERIEFLLKEWNKKNSSPLSEGYLMSQIRYHKIQKKKILPPNCANNLYYKELACCKPDNLCSKIKNPVSYSTRKTFYLKKERKK